MFAVKVHNIPTNLEVPGFTCTGDQHESSSQLGLQGAVRAGAEASEVLIKDFKTSRKQIYKIIKAIKGIWEWARQLRCLITTFSWFRFWAEMLRNSDCYHWAGIAGALAISSLTFRKGNNQLIRAIKVDGDLVEVQNQFPYSLSLQDVVLSKGLPCPFCSVLSAQAQTSFARFPYGCQWKLSATTLWLLGYSSFSLMVWQDINQEERKKRKKKMDKSRIHEGSVLFPVILVYCWKAAWYNHLLIERS